MAIRRPFGRASGASRWDVTFGCEPTYRFLQKKRRKPGFCRGQRPDSKCPFGEIHLYISLLSSTLQAAVTGLSVCAISPHFYKYKSPEKHIEGSAAAPVGGRTRAAGAPCSYSSPKAILRQSYSSPKAILRQSYSSPTTFRGKAPGNLDLQGG